MSSPRLCCSRLQERKRAGMEVFGGGLGEQRVGQSILTAPQCEWLQMGPSVAGANEWGANNLERHSAVGFAHFHGTGEG